MNGLGVAVADTDGTVAVADAVGVVVGVGVRVSVAVGEIAGERLGRPGVDGNDCHGPVPSGSRA